MSYRFLIVGVFLASLLAGCAGLTGGSDKSQPKVAAAACVWPGTSQTAPGWTCDEPVEGVEVSAVGIYEKTAAGLQFQKDQATAAARIVLAQQMRVHVTNMIKQYAEVTGAVSSETVDKVNTSVSKLITNETLDGSRVFRSAVSPAGSLYVLVGFDPKLVSRKTEDVIKTSMNNDRALWQQFKAKQAQDELAAAIAAGQASKP
ncbi:MAG: LPP20 family lipoprotein [Burkholderiales bacterium]|nr:LPP20 family lipoprotein [Burkholderiales bacterium]